MSLPHRSDYKKYPSCLDPSQWMKDNFKTDSGGYLVFKNLGPNIGYQLPPEWVIEPGQFISQEVDSFPDRLSGNGVSFATLEWCLENLWQDDAIWMCRIHWIDLPSITVPLKTLGMARCSRLQLLFELPYHVND